MEDKLEMLIYSKEWNELTNEEKEFALQHVDSVEQYTALRKISLSLENFPKLQFSEDPQVLKSLKSAFRKKHQPSLERFLHFRTPGLATILLLVLAAGIGWYFGQQSTGTAAKASIEFITKTDTVYLKTAADTVYLNKVVYRYLPEPSIKKPVFSVVKSNVIESKGVSMKEKEELDNLLVSGSE